MMRPYPDRADQFGFAVPTLLIAMVLMMGVLSVGAVAAINTQRGTVRDVNSKSALAIAETGANIALLRYNRAVTNPEFGLGDNGETCVIVDSSETGQPIAEAPVLGGAWDGWCRAESDVAGEGHYTYWVESPVETTDADVWKIRIVSRGEIGGPDGRPELNATRVIQLEADARQEVIPTIPDPDPDPEPEPPPGAYIGTENIVGIDWLAVDGDSPITSNAGSNGQVYIQDSARICGDVRIGQGTEVPVGPHLAHWMEPPAANYSNGQGGGICYTEGEPEHSLDYGTKEFAPVVLPEGLAPETSATNRFFAEDGNDLPDWYIGTPELRNQRWDPVTRTLTIDAGLTLHLRATYPYFLCRLVLAGGASIVADAPDQPVQIFFDKPENCPYLPTVTPERGWYLPRPHWQPGSKQQLQIANGTSFQSNGHVPGLFFLGSDTIPTGIVMAGGSETHEMVVYAPKTEIDISGDFKFRGAMVGKTLRLGGGSRIETHFDGTSYPIPVDPPPPPDPEENESPDPDPPEVTSSFSGLQFSECVPSQEIAPASLSCGRHGP